MNQRHEDRITDRLIFDDNECDSNPDQLSHDQDVGDLLLLKHRQDQRQQVVHQSCQVHEHDVATENRAQTQMRAINALEQMVSSLRH